MRLELPEIISRSNPSSILYGGDHLVKKYTNALITPTWIHGEWVHGVSYDIKHFHPYAVIGGNALNPHNPNWVVRKKDEEYLIEHGFKAKAIGAPICYLPKLDVEYSRVKGSLLVMPAHSSHYISSYAGTKKNAVPDYIDYIVGLADDFEHVVVCLHAECIKKDLWGNEFLQKGIRVIHGASTHDINALERIRALMSQFEFVTSNVLGSHIAYAASYGAKVSIAGPYHQWDRDSFLNEPFYAANEYLLDVLLNDEQWARGALPFLFVNPKEAQSSLHWGEKMVGLDNVISPTEMIDLFKINSLNEIKHRIARNTKNLIRPLVRSFFG
jgi:hypothetical protein